MLIIQCMHNILCYDSKEKRYLKDQSSKIGAFQFVSVDKYVKKYKNRY